MFYTCLLPQGKINSIDEYPQETAIYKTIYKQLKMVSLIISAYRGGIAPRRYAESLFYDH